MKEIELTWKIALRIWWSYSWRCVVIILPVTFVVGAIAGVVLGATSGGVEGNAVWLQLLGGLVSGIFSFIILRDVLAKRYKGFRLAVVTTEQEEKPSVTPTRETTAEQAIPEEAIPEEVRPEKRQPPENS